jgi:dGTPase
MAWQAGRLLLKQHSVGLSHDDVSHMATIAATCGLIHDLGNPPFGHAGELAISSWFAARSESDPILKSFAECEEALAAEFSPFEGNAQATRLLTRLQPAVHGWSLDLTFAILSAAGKYLASAVEVEEDGRHEYSKNGFFRSEADVVKAVREATGTVGQRHPLTYLVEAADDIVYTTVDVEDSVKKGILTWQEVERELGADVHGSEVFHAAIERAHQIVNMVVPETRAQHQEFATAFRTSAIGEFVPAVIEIFIRRYDVIMHGEYHGELVMDEECRARSLIRACKQLLRRTVYRSPSVLGLEILGRQVIHGLMDLFWEGVCEFDPTKQDVKSYGRKIYNLFSANYRSVFEQRLADGVENETYVKLQLVIDQVAGMTDAYACSTYRQLTLPPR